MLFRSRAGGHHGSLTHLLGHLFHDVVGDVGDGGVTQDADDVVVILLLQHHGADAPVVDMGVESTDEDQETQEQQGQDQLLHTVGDTGRRSDRCCWAMECCCFVKAYLNTLK